MNFYKERWGAFCIRGTSALILALTIAGCDRGEVAVYKVAKEAPSQASTGNEMGGHNHEPASGGMPQLTYKTPSGWEEVAPGEMRVASFKVNSGGKLVDISVVPLPGMAGSDLDNVNRWRKQVGLDGVAESELAKLSVPVEIAGDKAQLFDQAGTNSSSGEKSRILATVLRKDGVAWFFKASGDPDLIESNRGAFSEFLKSVQFSAPAGMPPGMAMGGTELPPSHPPIGGGMPGMGAAPMMAAAAGAAAPSGDHPDWQVPPAWKEISGGQFLAAKFLVGGEQSGTVVNVSVSGGDGGGLSMNVNRWRKQLGLADASEAEMGKLVQSITVAAGKASVVDLSGTDARTGKAARVIGVIVPVQGASWFYKLMGGSDVVEQEKGAFLKFVETVKYPHA